MIHALRYAIRQRSGCRCAMISFIKWGSRFEVSKLIGVCTHPPATSQTTRYAMQLVRGRSTSSGTRCSPTAPAGPHARSSQQTGFLVRWSHSLPPHLCRLLTGCIPIRVKIWTLRSPRIFFSFSADPGGCFCKIKSKQTIVIFFFCGLGLRPSF